MFEIIKRKIIANEIIKQYTKSERQLNPSETGRILEFIKIAEYEDSGVGDRKVTDPLQQHEWVNIAVDFRARNLARCDFKLLKGETEVTSGDEFDLFMNVNPYMSKYQLWEATESWRMVRGEALWVLTGKDKKKLGIKEKPQQIWMGDPNHFVAELNKKKDTIMKWIWYENVKDIGHEKKGVPFSIREIIHFKMWNKWNFFRGVNYWIAQEQNIEQDFEAARSNTSLIKNKSIPPGILSADQTLTTDQAKKLVESWEEQHKGSRKTGKIAVTGHGAKYQPIAMSHSDMQYFEMKKWNRVTILAKAGIPPVLVSVKDESTPLSGTDTKEQQKVFWDQTMIPETKSLEDKLRTEYFARFEIDMDGEFDLSNIDELQEDYGKKVEKAKTLFSMGFTRNEINEKLDLGFDEVEWGDVGYRPMSFKPMRAEDADPPQPSPFGFGGAPAPTPEPAPNTPPEAPQGSSRAKQERWLINYLLQSRYRWDDLEERYRAKIKAWLYEQRKYFLDKYGKNLKQKTYEEFLFWVKQEEQLRIVSKEYFIFAVEEAGKDLVTIFRQTGFNADFELFQVDADRIIDTRLDMIKGLVDVTRKAIDTTIRDALGRNFTPGEMADALRKDYRKLGNHADTIARTELGIIKSDAEAQAYIDEGVERIMWIHTGLGATQRPDHAALHLQERLYLQEGFQTDWGELMYPHDPNGAAGDIINCYCDFVPVPKEET